MIWEDFIALAIAGLACGFVDSILGMGYGVTSASVLMSFGLAPAVASAPVHTAEAFVDTILAVVVIKQRKPVTSIEGET